MKYECEFKKGKIFVDVKESGEDNPLGLIIDIWRQTKDGSDLELCDSFTYWYEDLLEE